MDAYDGCIPVTVYMGWNVYLGETLTCKDSGEPIKVERIE